MECDTHCMPHLREILPPDERSFPGRIIAGGVGSSVFPPGGAGATELLWPHGTCHQVDDRFYVVVA